MNRREGGEAIHSFGSEDTVQWLIRIEMFPKFLGRNIFLILLNNLSLSKAVGEYFWTYASCELFLKGEEGFGELFGIEFLQIVRFFTEADEFDGQV